ncbi:MAG TPA: hypothetical protein VGD81_12600 [Opitutaceae bacterium]
MSLPPETFRAVYPRLMQWMNETRATHAEAARPVLSLPHRRLWTYFEPATLAQTKVVVTDQLPLAPFAALGLKRFDEWDAQRMFGVTYLDTIFIRPKPCADDTLFCMQMVRAAQWRILGPERFLRLYIEDIARLGPELSVFEDRMSEKAEMFETGMRFNIERSLLHDYLTLPEGKPPHEAN